MTDDNNVDDIITKSAIYISLFSSIVISFTYINTNSKILERIVVVKKTLNTSYKKVNKRMDKYLDILHPSSMST